MRFPDEHGNRNHYDCGDMYESIFPADEIPFNLAGELIDNSTTAEGEARVRAVAESEARKAQLALKDALNLPEML